MHTENCQSNFEKNHLHVMRDQRKIFWFDCCKNFCMIQIYKLVGMRRILDQFKSLKGKFVTEKSHFFHSNTE